MDSLVEIANFQQTEKAEILATILRSEGIDCYVRNAHSNLLLQGYVDIGARVEVLEKDYERSLKIMEQGGFITSDIMNESSTNHPTTVVSFYKSLSLEKRVFIVIFLIAGLLALFIYIESIISSSNA